MSLIDFLKEFGEAAEDIQEEQKKIERAREIAKLQSKRRR